MYLKNKAFRFNLWTFVLSEINIPTHIDLRYCQVSYHAPRSTKNFTTLDRWHTRPANNINGFLKMSTITYYYLFFIILMNEKSVSISVYLENKTTKIRLSPCVHITFCTVTFRYLWMLTSYVTGGCCHISVVSGCYGFPLKLKLKVRLSIQSLHRYTLLMVKKSQLFWKQLGNEAEVVQCSFKELNASWEDLHLISNALWEELYLISNQSVSLSLDENPSQICTSANWSAWLLSVLRENTWAHEYTQFNSGCLYQWESRDSSATRIFFKKNRMMQHRTQKLTTKF